MKMRFKKLTSAVVCLAVLTATSAVYFRRISKNLIERSELVYHGPPLSEEGAWLVLWRDEQDLLLSESKDFVTTRLWCYSVKTHQKQLLEDLVNPAVRDQFNGIDSQLWEARVSPNGRWLAWFDQRNVRFWRIGTSEFHECAADTSFVLMWSSDSKYCLVPDIESTNGKVSRCIFKEITGISTDRGRIAWHRDVPTASHLNDFVCFEWDIGKDHDVSGGANGLIVLAYWIQGSQNVAVVSQISTSDFTSASPECKIAVPSGGLPYEIKISPSGRRIAWLIYSDAGSPIERVMDRLTNGKMKQTNRSYLYVSDFNGNNMVQLGSMTSTQSDSTKFPSQLSWVPGERAVSYVCNDDLYRIAAQ